MSFVQTFLTLRSSGRICKHKPDMPLLLKMKGELVRNHLSHRMLRRRIDIHLMKLSTLFLFLQLCFCKCTNVQKNATLQKLNKLCLSTSCQFEANGPYSYYNLEIFGNILQTTFIKIRKGYPYYLTNECNHVDNQQK